MEIKDKKITILGAVRSGIAAAKLAKKLGAVTFVSDMGNEKNFENAKEEFDKLKINYEFGGHSDKVFDCDFIVTSPGVPSDSDVLTKAKSKGIEIFSELEFASWFCDGNITAITGTNGKTTATSLLKHVLNEANYRCYSAGNIGNAFSEIADNVKSNEFVALETSSFQLDYIKHFKPKFSMILNVTPDHLDRYENDFEKYKAAKFRVFENQNGEDLLVLNADDKDLQNVGEKSEVRKYYFSLNKKSEKGTFTNGREIIFSEDGNEDSICSIEDLYIRGEHNLANALAVSIIAKKVGLSNEEIRSGFSSFQGVEHRLELIREIGGIKFINDSKATNVYSVWYALKSFDLPILLILGGKDKGNNYDKIKDLVKERVRKIYAIGSSQDKVYDYFSEYVDVEKKKSLEECVISARLDAKENEVVLLSPACASFDMFDNFEHRGRVFKDAVMDLKS